VFIYVIILLSILAIGTMSLITERRRAQRARAAALDNGAAPDDIPSPATDLVQRIKGMTALRTSLPWARRDTQLPACFRTWAAQNLASDTELCSWLTGLSEPAYEAFVEHVAEFTDEMGFALTDLAAGRMACLPSVAAQATAVVRDFCRANHQAALAQADFDAYRIYATYLKEPTSSSSGHFVQELYAQLVALRIVAPPTPEVLAQHHQERLVQMQEVIEQIATQPEKLRVALLALVTNRQQSATNASVATIVQQAMSRITKSADEPSL